MLVTLAASAMLLLPAPAVNIDSRKWTSYHDQFEFDGEFYEIGLNHSYETRATGHYATIGSAGVRGHDTHSECPSDLHDWVVARWDEKNERMVEVTGKQAEEIALAFFENLDNQ